uniref:Integrase catalytic domain-containing protein n=1 Tax=Prevotella sp. GTC17253 TaxID=3236793 RepID=A0AB33IUP5_9BACT
MARRKRSVSNSRKDDALIWRIKNFIIEEQWSPQQISGYLLRDEGIKVSRQTIYNLVYNDGTGVLASHMRHKLRHRTRPKGRHLPIKDRVSIHERSKEVDGKRFGDFEMDLIVDSESNAILTLVEKSTSMLFMQKLPMGKQSKPLAKVVRKLLLPYKKHIRTITTDNEPEFAAHKDITEYLGVPVYFAAPYASWQKGAIENLNKLIRQYIPKKENFSKFTDKNIMTIQKKLNRRPREKINFSTPKKEFFNKIS